MRKKEMYIAGGLLVFFLLISKKVGRSSYQVITDWLIPEFEGFRATPYWDVSRYSWGYGTQAPGPTGTITKEQALADMRAFVNNDYNYLKPLIDRELSGNQWAALLSFSYNLGRGNADNLVPNINSGDTSALGDQWNSYVYAGGVRNSVLVNRRRVEWDIWNGVI